MKQFQWSGRFNVQWQHVYWLAEHWPDAEVDWRLNSGPQLAHSTTAGHNTGFNTTHLHGTFTECIQMHSGLETSAVSLLLTTDQLDTTANDRQTTENNTDQLDTTANDRQTTENNADQLDTTANDRQTTENNTD